MSSAYGKWDAYEGSSDSDAPDERDKSWCEVHRRMHYGECLQCAGRRTGPMDGLRRNPLPYVPKRDPEDVDAAMDGLEGKVRDGKRAKDVLHELKAKIDTTPDDEVDVMACIHAIKTAAAYSPPDSSLRRLLKTPSKTGLPGLPGVGPEEEGA